MAVASRCVSDRKSAIAQLLLVSFMQKSKTAHSSDVSAAQLRLQMRPILATLNTVRHILVDLIHHIAGIRLRILTDAQALVSKR